MPVGRPPKRPGDGLDCPLDTTSGPAKSKLARLERGPEDFSSVVKSKLQSHSRTGQACDRCKVRKIRCDALPEGCTHCTQQTLECYVTDRVTGRTERRGYLAQLEREKNSLTTHIQDLEKLLEQKGVQVRQWQPPSAFGPGTGHELDNGGLPKKDWTQFQSLWIKDRNLQPGGYSSGEPLGQSSGRSSPAPLPSTIPRPIGTHLGVLKDNSPVSTINGTQLSILGTTIDITSFDSPDMDGPPAGTSNATPIYNKSLQSFYNSIAKVNPPLEAPMPSREDAFSYSEWFFCMVGAFCPVLHKPTYFEMLARIYDDREFKPRIAEQVIVHMVFAIMYYQFRVRNGGDAERKAQLNDISNRHYHWSVQRLWDISSDLSLPAVQALTLITIHCRGFPKPGPAWLMCGLAWNRAIELNLHRAYLKPGEPTTLENEMRKRTWWGLFMVTIMLYGRLGKPMPIRFEDIDVEYPEIVSDDCLTANGIIDSGRPVDCYWLVGSEGFKLSVMYMNMWNEIYAMRHTPKSYIAAVRRLEQACREYQRNLPDELKVDKCKPANRVVATVLEASTHEFLLCLRHPSRCATADPAFVAENHRVCEDAARKTLTLANQLARLKSLDTTWYQMAVYVAAIFTLLAYRWERRSETTPAELADLKECMSIGLSVLYEIFTLIAGSTSLDSRVMGQITAVIDRTVASIEQDMVPQRASRTSTPHYSQHQLPSMPQTMKHDEYGSSGRQSRAPKSLSRTPTPMSSGTEHMPSQRFTGGQNTSYYNSPLAQINTAYAHMGYPELGNSVAPPPPTTSAGAPYASMTDESNHQQYLYATSAAATASQMVHNTPTSSPTSAAAPHGHMVGYPAQHQPGPPAHHHHHQPHGTSGGHWMTVQNGGNTWNEWTTAMVDPSTQDRYSANALLTLGQRGPSDAGGGEMGVGGPGGPQGHSGSPWPMVMYQPPNVSGA
ncbi:unnamed protein product [Discula destructiva]